MAGGLQTINELWEGLDDDLVRVKIDNKRYDIPESLVEAVQQAPSPEGVALVPPNDPYLRQVDRALLIPNTTRRKAVYRALSGPGALLVDGEVAGTWRYRRTERQMTIETFEPLTSAQEKSARKSATALCTSTGDGTPEINWSKSTRRQEG